MVTDVAAETAEHAENAGLIGTFGINWKIFLGQLINFGIVLFIFWRWFVKPIGKALRDRQERIEAGIKNAENLEQERKTFAEEKTHELRKVRVEAETIIKNAESVAEKIKSETLSAASTQAEKMLEQTQAALEQEKQKMLQVVRGEAANLVAAATGHILKEKIDPAKDRELIDEAITKVARA